MAKPKETKFEPKTFDLKQVELQMINNMQNRANQQLFDMCSFIAMERLAYTPNENTRFQVEDQKLVISEAEPEQPKEEEVAQA